MPKFNPELFKTFAYIHSKRRKVWCVYRLSEMPIYSSKLSKFANNSPILFIFNFWSRDMAQEDLKQWKRQQLYFKILVTKIKLKNNPQIAKAKINI